MGTIKGAWLVNIKIKLLEYELRKFQNSLHAHVIFGSAWSKLQIERKLSLSCKEKHVRASIVNKKR